MNDELECRGEKPTRKERDRLRREEDLLGAAERIFAREGYHATNMEDIAREAEYATGTIYRYFRSKEDLYHQIILRKGRNFFEHVFETVAVVDAPVERLRMLIRAKIGFFSEHREFLKIYVQEISGCGLGGGDERLPEETRAMKGQYLDLLRQAFREGMDRGVFRRLDVELLVAAVTSVTNELLTHWLEEDGQRDPAVLERFVIELLETGIRMEEGRERCA